METPITPEIVIAYSQCPRKAYLLLFSPDKGEPHEYVQILEQQRCENQERYLTRLQQTHTNVQPYSLENLRKGSEVLINARLQVDGLEAACGVLTRVEGKSTLGKHYYEPTVFVGTYSISTEQKLALSFVGYVLGRLQRASPMAGNIIGVDGKAQTVKLGESAKALTPILEPLQEWTTVDSPTPPPIVLNKHCPLCPFQRLCHAQAEQEDNLSLLDGVTARVMRQYERKGIFTVKQLSYLFKPRKRKKGSRKPPPVIHKVELQALAIREKKIYLQELPALSRQPVELFVDIEGVPDRGFYYLIGLLVCQGDVTEHHAFWADTDQDEYPMWQQFVDAVTQYPDAPIYHYGSYEPRAIATLAKRYDTEGESLRMRLVNVNRYIYGKVYFPVRSNRLKDIGHFIGAKWTSPNASGLQSLVWRHQWEASQDASYRNRLMIYNQEDCYALLILRNKLLEISETSEYEKSIDFVTTPKKHATEQGMHIHEALELMLQYGHLHYDRKKIKLKPGSGSFSFQSINKERESYARIIPHPQKRVRVPMKRVCAVCHRHLRPREDHASMVMTDLVFTTRGCRKTVIKYAGKKGWCFTCRRIYQPNIIARFERRNFGHNFISWVVYQRIILRLPYEVIAETAAEMFNIGIAMDTVLELIYYFSEKYAETERIILKRLRESPFIHADETKINIQGKTYYVWVFTDGRHVIFKLTETREATIAHAILAQYKGVLISDFYPGYDAIPCPQQKCWAHFIRDLNDALWKEPFNEELERFVLAVKNLIVPILQTAKAYGLKRRHLKKFQKPIDKFYSSHIHNKIYKSESVTIFQKRFTRYRESLFTFIAYDGIDWNNNMAERNIQPIAIQRKISMAFREKGAARYLLLLGIAQTCKFQGKSFLKFLLSKEREVDMYKPPQRIMYSKKRAKNPHSPIINN
jgi:predicted RecB family nuclease